MKGNGVLTWLWRGAEYFAKVARETEEHDAGALFEAASDLLMREMRKRAKAIRRKAKKGKK